MIIVKLLGGLGNQMFQYASARGIACHKNTTLKLDISCFKDFDGAAKRKYELSCFNIVEEFAAPGEITRLKGRISGGLCGKLSKIANKLKPCSKRSYVKERHFHFDPGMFNIAEDAYLEGYWQSEKYFKHIEGVLRREFTIKYKTDGKNRDMAALISSVPSVSIHIRRGDYITDAKTNAVHGTCGLDYYHRAVDIVAKNIGNPHFFIFSDDPAWVKDNFTLKHPVTYVTQNLGRKDYEDLRLMSCCCHQIIANSSFSWWGAWLNGNQDKMVIAPKKWFNNPGLNTKDLVPGTWKRI